MEAIKVNSYRFSISWARILPSKLLELTKSDWYIGLEDTQYMYTVVNLQAEFPMIVNRRKIWRSKLGGYQLL